MRAILFRVCSLTIVLLLTGVLLILVLSFYRNYNSDTRDVLVPELHTRLRIEVKTTNSSTTPSESAVPNALLQYEHLSNRSTTMLYPSENPTDENPSNNRFPQVFIVGFAKAGTKALYEALKLHDQLGGPLKEMRYFTEHYGENIQSYLNKFPLPPPSGGHNIEKSPDYILSLQAAHRLKKASLKVNVQPTTLKFVIVLRNPVVRTVSDYMELKVWALTNHVAFPSTIRERVLNSQGEVDSSTKIVNSSCYAYHIKRWMTVFNSKQFCFVNGDKFIQDPYLELKSLENCLGLSSYYQRYNFVFNKRRGFYCFVGTNRQGRICMSRSKGRKHPFVHPGVVEKLKNYFQPWNQELYKMLNRTDFQWEESEDF